MSFSSKSRLFILISPSHGQLNDYITILSGKEFLCIKSPIPFTREKDNHYIKEGNIYTVVSRVYSPRTFKELIKLRQSDKEENEDIQPFEISREIFNECLTNDIQKIREFNLNKILKK